MRPCAAPTEEPPECKLRCYRTEILLYTGCFSLGRSWPASSGQKVWSRQNTSTLRLAAIAGPLAFLHLKTGGITTRTKKTDLFYCENLCCGYGYVFTTAWTHRSNPGRGVDHARCEQADCSPFLPSHASRRDCTCALCSVYGVMYRAIAGRSGTSTSKRL